MPTVVFDASLNVDRSTIQREFCSANIDARVFFWPLSSLPMFKAVCDNQNSWSIANRAINLPSYHDIVDEEIAQVFEVVERIHHHATR
jgi:perosamine synthetase